MSPPGKNSGETTNESVVNASRPAAVVSDAPSSSGSSSGFRKASRNTASISVCVAFPPAPWESVIRSSRIRGLRARALAIRSSTCSSRVRCSAPAWARTASSAQSADVVTPGSPPSRAPG
jgi:hypothetical protein